MIGTALYYLALVIVSGLAIVGADYVVQRLRATRRCKLCNRVF